MSETNEEEEESKSVEAETASNPSDSFRISSERVIKEQPNLIRSIKDIPHSGWYTIPWTSSASGWKTMQARFRTEAFG